MGGKVSKRSSIHSNRVNDSHNGGKAESLDSVNRLEEIKVPDTRSKHKSTSLLFGPFTKRSFIRQTSSFESAVTSHKKDNFNPFEKLRKENEDLKEKIQQLEKISHDEQQFFNNQIAGLKNEVKTLTNALQKVYLDKDKALLTEKDAIQRANNFEVEKEKIQRQFKIFREAKEEEVSNLLKDKQILQNQLRRLIENEGSINEILMETGDLRHSRSINEWLLEGQSGTDSFTGQHNEDSKWKQFSHTNKKSKEVCKSLKSVIHSLQNAADCIPYTNVYSTYMTSTYDLKPVAELFIAQCKMLQYQLEQEGRLLSISYFLTLLNAQLDKIEVLAKDQSLESSDIVIVFIQQLEDLGNGIDTIWKALQSNKICFVASVDEISVDNFHFLTNGLQNDSKLKFIHGNGEEEQLVYACYQELVSTCKQFHNKQLQREQFMCYQDNSALKYSEDVFKSWDMFGLNEQCSLKSTYKANSLNNDIVFKDIEEELNHYITKDGPQMPMLVQGAPGSGKSTLLANWISSIENSLPNSCILYHVAHTHTPYSTDPLHILRRFLIILLEHLPICFGTREIEQEFPSWLDRACNKYKNGVVIVIDNIDLIHNYKEYFKWLIDPLPVPVRVIVSVASHENHPKQWSQWNKIQLQYNAEDTEQICRQQFEEVENELTLKAANFLQQVIRTANMIPLLSNHLYRNLFFTTLQLSMSDGETNAISTLLMNANDISNLYILMIEIICTRHEKSLVRSVLLLILLSSDGLSLGELQELHGFDHGLLPLLYELIQCELLCKVGPLIKVKHTKGVEAIQRNYEISLESNDPVVLGFRSNLVAIFEHKLSLNFTSYRVADELPSQLIALKDNEKLLRCMSSIFVFIHLYRRGRYLCIVKYWKILGKDFNGIQKVYERELQEHEKEKGFDAQITMLYDTVGSFFKDIGQYSIAQAYLEKSLEMKEEHLEPDDNLLRRSHFLLAKLFTQWEKYPTAEECLKQALDVNDVLSDSEPSLATLLDFHAGLCMLQGKTKDADMHRKTASTMKENIFMKYDLVNVKNMLTECHQLVNVILETKRNVSIEDVTSWMINISYVYVHVNQFQEAAEVLQQALKHLTADSDGMSNYQTVADVMCKLSFVYTKLGQNDKAEGILETALNTYFKLNLLEDPNLMVVISSLVKLYNSQTGMEFCQDLVLFLGDCV